MSAESRAERAVREATSRVVGAARLAVVGHARGECPCRLCRAVESFDAAWRALDEARYGHGPSRSPEDPV